MNKVELDVLFAIKVDIIGVSWKYTCGRSLTSLSFVKKESVKGYIIYSSSLLQSSS